MIKWRFPSNDHGQIQGINDSGVSFFKGTPLKSLAREICQNSLDAAREKTVVVDFNLSETAMTNIPGTDVLKETFTRCFDFWKIQKDGATREFFAKAKEAIARDKCAILRISDHKTTGLVGSREILNTDWVNLTKAAGASDKKGTAGGSFGIGKYAPFACSDFSTVFYSTYDINKEKAYQGISRLVTFEREDGEYTQGTGYYGEERNTPVYEEISLEDGYKRSNEDYGTDIFIVGYKFYASNWKSDIIVSVLDSFLGAIWNEQLIVNVGDVEISKANLEVVVEEYEKKLLNDTSYYYTVLKSSETKWISEDFNGMGEVKFGILLGDQEAPKKVAMIRKTGMKIKDKDRLSSFPYVGVLFINGEELNKRLRSIENPKHDEWEPERDVVNPHRSRALLKNLYDFLKLKIQNLIQAGNGEEMDAAGAGTYLPDKDGDTDKAKEEVVSNKIYNIDTKAHPPRVKKPASFDFEEDDDGDEYTSEKTDNGTGLATGGEDIGWVPGNGKAIKPGDGTGLHKQDNGGNNQQKPVISKVVLKKFLPLCVNKAIGAYVIIVTAAETFSNINLKVFLSGETTNYPAEIKSAKIIGGTDIKINENILTNLKLTKDVPVRIKIELNYYEMCSMEVEAYAVKE